MDQMLEVLKAIGLPPAMLGTVVMLALMLRFARGSLSRFGSTLTLAVAGALGALGAWFELPSGSAVKDLAHVACTVMVAVLIAQKGLQALATKVPWLPEDNEWVKDPAAPTPAPAPPA